MGRTVTLRNLPVLSVSETGYTVETRAGPCHVTSRLRPRPGDRIEAVAVAEGFRRVAATRDRVSEDFVWKRGVAYGVSVAVLVAFFWTIRRHFRWRAREGIFRSRY